MCSSRPDRQRRQQRPRSSINSDVKTRKYVSFQFQLSIARILSSVIANANLQTIHFARCVTAKGGEGGLLNAPDLQHTTSCCASLFKCTNSTKDYTSHSRTKDSSYSRTIKLIQRPRTLYLKKNIYISEKRESERNVCGLSFANAKVQLIECNRLPPAFIRERRAAVCLNAHHTSLVASGAIQLRRSGANAFASRQPPPPLEPRETDETDRHAHAETAETLVRMRKHRNTRALGGRRRRPPPARVSSRHAPTQCVAGSNVQCML